MIEQVIESPKTVETGDEEIAIVDNEHHIVNEDIALMEDVETQSLQMDITSPQLWEVSLIYRISNT